MPGIVQRTAGKLAQACGLPTYVGMLHWSPTIEETTARMAGDGVSEALAICMTPHYSAASIGRYERRVAAAADACGVSFEVVQDWHTAAPYVDGVAESIRESAGDPSGPAGPPHVVFTAHSLPKAALAPDDPYEARLRETAALVAGKLGISAEGWTLAFQSISGPEDDWLGPSVAQIVSERAERGEDRLVVCPFGFLADQVEVLYDLDIALKQKAAGLGVTILRAPLLNDGPAVIDSLTSLVERWQA
jgi:protoporphyrin/coproporphyrin ferrochelatase